MPGKFIFISGLSGAGKSTLVDAVLKAIDNIETVATYTTRPMRAGEEDSYEHVFVSDDEYESLKTKSGNWDETIYADYKYGADGEKYFNDLHSGMSVIVPVAPDMQIIRKMAQKYNVQPVTVWVDTDEVLARDRTKDDNERSARDEDANIKNEFDHIFQPVGNIDTDSAVFIKIISDIIEPSHN